MPRLQLPWNEIADSGDFDIEIGAIPDPDLRDKLRHALCDVPRDFWMIPAAKRATNHPAFAHGSGGLVRHSKFIIYLIDMLQLPKSGPGLHVRNSQFISRLPERMLSTLWPRDWDMCDLIEKHAGILIASAILHDSFKQVNGEDNFKYHYVNAADHANIYGIQQNLIRTHMGRFAFHDCRPTTYLEFLFHFFDYYSSVQGTPEAIEFSRLVAECNKSEIMGE